MRERAEELLAGLSPSIQLPGREALALAIWRAAELMEARGSSHIAFTREVYQFAANGTRSTLMAAERAIYRAVEACWQGGRNEALHCVIGRALSEKPTPREFILYCAYYLRHGRAYHGQSGGLFSFSPSFSASKAKRKNAARAPGLTAAQTGVRRRKVRLAPFPLIGKTAHRSLAPPLPEKSRTDFSG